MRVKDIVAELRNQGYQVKVRVRGAKEGSGLRITSINGKSFTGSAGNKYARQLLNTDLSDLQRRHLESIKSPKKKFGNVKRKLEPVDDETKKRIKRLQRQFKKKGIKNGVPTLRNYRYALRHYDKAEADRLLEQAERYLKGQAYTKNIEVLIERMKNDQTTHYNQDIEDAKDIIENYYNIGAPEFMDYQLNNIYDYLYIYEENINIQEDARTAAKNLLTYVKLCEATWK